MRPDLVERACVKVGRLCPLHSPGQDTWNVKPRLSRCGSRFQACLYCCLLGSPSLLELSLPEEEGRLWTECNRWFHPPCIFTVLEKSFRAMAWGGYHCDRHSYSLDWRQVAQNKSVCSPCLEARRSQHSEGPNGRDPGGLLSARTE